jgi:soluble lytic murein transglycosylase-like protein
LAKRQLGQALIETRHGPVAQEDAITAALAIPNARRAVALAQIGNQTLAESEMRRAHGKADKRHDPALMHLAMTWNLPSAQIDIANGSVLPELTVGRYPIPSFEPKGGFTLDRALIYAFIRQESRFNTEATSRVGARGLMQLMPRTAVHVSKDRSLRSHNKDRLYDPSYNMMLGQKYITELMNEYDLDDNLFGLLVAYNGGPGNLRKWTKSTDYKEDPLLFIESIPSRETRGFIEAVLGNYWMYQARLGDASPSLDLVASGTWPAYTQLTD